MAKVTVTTDASVESPSQAVVKSANQLTYVTDARGRKLGLRPVPFLEQFRVVEMVGAERATNQVYMGMLNPVLCVAEIDGEKIDFPRTHAQAEALINRVGEDGFVAAMAWIAEQVTDRKEHEEKVKNGLGTPG